MNRSLLITTPLLLLTFTACGGSDGPVSLGNDRSATETLSDSEGGPIEPTPGQEKPGGSSGSLNPPPPEESAGEPDEPNGPTPPTPDEPNGPTPPTPDGPNGPTPPTPDDPGTHIPCGDLACGDPCSQCHPDAIGCVETSELKFCNADGQCESAANPPSCEPSYDPCAGKACGEDCSVCPPNDPTCSETSEEKACNLAGECRSRINGGPECNPENACEAPEEYFSPGCSPEPGQPLLTGGCYAPCGADLPCEAGFSCESRHIDPCFGAACQACGGEESVCIPL